MRRSSLLSVFTGVLAITISACDARPNGNSNGNKSNQSGGASGPSLTEIGEALYANIPIPEPSQPPAGTLMPVDPIVIRVGQVSLPQTQNVPSKNNGRILWFCTEISDDDIKKLSPEQVKELIFEHPASKDPSKKVKYRKLHENDVLQPNQLVALLDNALARANYLSAKAAINSNESKKIAAVKVFEASEQEFKMYDGLWKSRTGSESDARRSYAQMERSRADISEADAQVVKAREDLNKAEVILDEHEIRSTIGGVIKRFYRKPGESIRELDPVAEVQNIDNYRIEGMLDVQYMAVIGQQDVRNRHKVIIEQAPQREAGSPLIGHLQPVRAVAVSKDPRKPLIVSASEDRTARVWDRQTRLQVAKLEHPGAVRAIACSPPLAAENYCITGADDGVVRLWDLDNLASGKPLREMGSASDKHQNRIICAAFAPDGKTCATADEREIILWDVATGKSRYPQHFPIQHKAPITSIQFTPQSQLISSARDRSIIVWRLGDKGAAFEYWIENRAGDIATPGVSPDGKRVLFDQERSIHVLSLPGQVTEGVINTPSDAIQFSTFALFSPDARLVLAAGTGDMPLQLWKAPPLGGRGSLIRRLATGPNSTPTCAAFSPDGAFAVTGTQDNHVLIWDMPNKAELDRQLVGELAFVDTSINPAERRARFWAELKNPGIQLLEGDTVAVVVPRPTGR